MSRWRPFSASTRAQIQQNRTHTDRHAPERGHSHPVPPTPYLLMGQRELERGRGVTQSEYVSELDGSGDGACVVGDEILGGAPLGSIRGVINGSSLSGLGTDASDEPHKAGAHGAGGFDKKQ